MISKYLGEDVFINGVQKYLKEHAYGSIDTRDLWTALEDVSDKPVQKLWNSGPRTLVFQSSQ